MKKIFALLLAMAMTLCAAGALAHDISAGALTLDNSCSAGCLHEISGTTTRNTITVKGGTHGIQLNGVQIDCSNSNACAFSIEGGTVNLTLEGDNTLQSGKEEAGIRVAPNAALTIAGSGSLKVTGGTQGAGIGGSKKDTQGSGTITINNGTIHATAGSGGAGIGGSYGRANGAITINGGSVYATGLYAPDTGAGAGIGGGDRAAAKGKIEINGGTVTAVGGWLAAGIGGGRCDSGSAGGYGSGAEVIITGGTVHATGGTDKSGSGGASIGAGNGGHNGRGTLKVSGGTVYAYGLGTSLTAPMTVDPQAGQSIQVRQEKSIDMLKTEPPTVYEDAETITSFMRAIYVHAYSSDATPRLNWVKFSANGGTGSMDEQLFTDGESKPLTANAFTRPGYTFTGWADKDGKTYADKQAFEVSNSTANGMEVMLKAQWAPNSYKVEFYPNYDEEPPEPVTQDGFVYDAEKKLDKNTFTRDGYKFVGWFTFIGDKYTRFADEAVVKNLTTDDTAQLAALWEPVYTIRFDANVTDGSVEGTIPDLTELFLDDWVLLEDGFWRDGYSFEGFNTAADGTGKAYSLNFRYEALTDVPGDVVVLYAQWKKLPGDGFLQENPPVDLPQTGDPSMLSAWALLLGMSAMGLKLRKKS